MLARHYRCGMTLETLLFDEVRGDDENTKGSEYVDVPDNVLPELRGSDFWWQELPPSGKLSVRLCRAKCPHP